ncbi:MAG TPA: class I SAM-dependent methyltransferase, partial [Solirubrobacteraceae bacterium]
MALTDLASRLAELTPSGTGLLRSEIGRVIPARPFKLEFWDGTSLPATTDDAPSFVVRSPEALAQFIRSPDQLGLGRAYVNGTLTVDDLDAAFIVVDTWEPPPIGVADRLRLMGAALATCRPWALPKTPELELILDGERHTIDRDKEAIRYHYDVGNDFFALFLDESMTYSCGLFSRGAETLAEAQRAKLDLVCQKLELRAGQRVLDVGCGWGSFAIHAAREYGVSVVGITLSPSQAELARELVAAAGVADRV